MGCWLRFVLLFLSFEGESCEVMKRQVLTLVTRVVHGLLRIQHGLILMPPLINS
jgi:hypothetical protein